MEVSWTREQQQVIDLHERNILVSAAAGSGKTAVLVARIIQMIIRKEHPIDIDRLLVVTFTNAAAAEMRERVGNAIEQELDKDPENEHLLRQLTLLHNAQITTIDSFCLYVIRNHFHEINLEPSFRIGDEGELKLLREDVLTKVLKKNYEELQEGFINFVESYATGRTDAGVSSMILQLYEFSRSYPWPGEWLDNCAKQYHVTDEKSLNASIWMQALVQYLQFVVEDLIRTTERARELCLENDGPYMYEKTLLSDLEQYQAWRTCSTFEELRQAISGISYARMSPSRGFDGSQEKQELCKNLRNQCKDIVSKITKRYFYTNLNDLILHIQQTEPSVCELVRLTKEFAEAFSLEKQRKNLVDFHDLEHFALQILVDEETRKPGQTAKEFQDVFEEIMIDEYQDSNYVQETILKAVSRETLGENNIFMVGDVKQSIYRFRLARPELFMEKYDTYTLSDSEAQRIDLHKNFRSRPEVLEFANTIFERIMSRDLGNVEYDSSAALYPGASFVESDQMEPELLLFSPDEEFQGSGEELDSKQLEAKMVAAKIKQMMKEQQITDKKSGELRKLRYSDIVILLRSLSGWSEAFVTILNDAGIPSHAVSSTGYFSTIEVQTVLSMLKILDNPRQDIPLAAVLRSPIGNFTDEELALLHTQIPGKTFSECVLGSFSVEDNIVTGFEPDSVIAKKIASFFLCFLSLRKKVVDTPIHELIEAILKETGYGAYAAAMPGGGRRRANLDMLLEKAIAYENTSYKGLFHFVRYIDELQKYDVDFGEADLISENEDVVRIMSIHKSKGLEFPVVILSGLGKKFNKQDVQSKMVLHPESGIGLDHMDGTKRTKVPTMIKRAIAKQIDLENLGEELRVLYVAMTRAKEKLVLTGSVKKYDAAMVESFSKERLLYLTRSSAMSYLDWILPALPEKCIPQIFTEADLIVEEIGQRVENQQNQEACMDAILHAREDLLELVSRQFEKKYPYAVDTDFVNKYSVSELKHRAMEENSMKEEPETVNLFEKDTSISYQPQFVLKANGTMPQDTVNQGALRGTAVHRVMECYDFAGNDSPQEQIQQMLLKEQITESMSQLVKPELIETFMKSQTGQRMAVAQSKERLYREKPFVMGFTQEDLEHFGFGDTAESQKDSAENSASVQNNLEMNSASLQKKSADENSVRAQIELADENSASVQKKLELDNSNQELEAESELTLIQGIIDVFWMEEDGIVLLDYKTDNVKTTKELVERYQAQLELYQEALERIYQSKGPEKLKVKEKLIYSFHLGTVISV